MPEAMRTSAARVVVIAAALALSAGSPALAADPLVTVDDPAPSVEEVDGGGYKLSVGLTNITGGSVDVVIDETSPALTDDCAVKVDGDTTASVPAASHRDVELTFDPGCVAADVNAVVLGAGPEPTQKLTLKPKDPDKPTPDWGQLWAFAIALGAAAAAGILVAFLWNVSPSRELANLPDTWKFSDSLVTNVTLLGSTLAGVVGSADVVRAFLGKESDASIALITVGAAVAAAIIGLGAVLLQATRKNNHFTVGGLLAASAMILGGAFGELYVAWKNGEGVTLGGWEGRLIYLVVPLALLLMGYSYVSLKETIEQGLTASKPESLELSADAIAAAVIASRMHGGITPADLTEQIRDALEGESVRRKAELETATTHAKPKSRLGFTMTLQPARSDKAALL